MNVIVIPARISEPLQEVHLDTKNLDAYENLVDGMIEAIDLYHPEASFYINEEGKLRRMPFNERATALWWAHNSAARDQDWIVGPAVLHGPVGQDGESTSVPEELAALLLHTRTFRIETATAPDGPFDPQAGRYDDWFIAYLHGLRLSDPLSPHQRFRVLPAQ
ncbi:DUF3846 domain-containing protein [Kineosporia babensis]|uniref:DUF3846 domain-containing protein n=1 Tax=Kineosporia babensis TaxID=499548 RepID=A0A9X1NM52_9ACTN|nr:DUF3846 domain-containing protein [Kineosporia babensis]MCD5316890.1 DUF3846 domain-containing protein [Kineosporia babensis]